MDIRTIARNRPLFRHALVPAALSWALVFLIASASVAPSRAAETDEAPGRKPPVSSFWGELLAIFGDLLPGKATKVVQARPARGGGDDDVAEHARSRVEIPADPYRDGRDRRKRNKLTAGERALHIRWRGGEAPFHVWLLRQEDDGATAPVMAVPEPVQSRTIVLPPLDLTPGRYVLIIKDARDYAKNPSPQGENSPRTEMELEVVPEDRRPVMPKNFAASAPERLRPLRYPTWLAGRSDGEWSLEAMRLAPPADESPEAAAWLSQWGGE